MKRQEIAITCVFGEEAVDIRAVILHSFLSMVKRELEKRDSLVNGIPSMYNHRNE